MIKVNLSTLDGMPPNSLYVIDGKGNFQGMIKDIYVAAKPKSKNIHALQDEIKLEEWLDGEQSLSKETIIAEKLVRVGDTKAFRVDRQHGGADFATKGVSDIDEAWWTPIWESMLQEGIPYHHVEREANITITDMWGETDKQFEFLFVRLWHF
jgi:hypothetical protein